MGAYLSLYAGFLHPGTFARIGVFSPALWFAEASMLEFLANRKEPYPDVWLDVGTDETSDETDPGFPRIYLSGARRIRDLLTDKGVRNLAYREIPGAVHSETAWAARFPDFVHWLFQA
jgi:predicted alpha/beta superfamily hydrolase